MPAAPASRAAGREVTPVELFRLLPAHFAAVLVCTLLGGILAFAATRLAPRNYQAEAQLYVAAAQEGLTSGYAELQLTADYQELLTSRTMLESLFSPASFPRLPPTNIPLPATRAALVAGPPPPPPPQRAPAPAAVGGPPAPRAPPPPGGAGSPAAALFRAGGCVPRSVWRWHRLFALLCFPLPALPAG